MATAHAARTVRPRAQNRARIPSHRIAQSALSLSLCGRKDAAHCPPIHSQIILSNCAPMEYTAQMLLSHVIANNTAGPIRSGRSPRSLLSHRPSAPSAPSAASTPFPLLSFPLLSSRAVPTRRLFPSAVRCGATSFIFPFDANVCDALGVCEYGMQSDVIDSYDMI